MNKKATVSDEVVLFIPRIIFLVAVIFVFVLLIKVLITASVDVREVESNILINRLLLSRGGLSYYDESSNRLYPGIIDVDYFRKLSKLDDNKQSALDRDIITYGLEKPLIAAKITLKPEGSDSVSIVYNNEGFEKLEPRASLGIEKGAGSVKAFKKQIYVLVRDETGLTPGILDFFVII